MSRTEQIEDDFDEIADLVDAGASGSERYDALLLSLVLSNASNVLDIGCGLGRLTRALAVGNREVVGVDLSPIMLRRARLTGKSDYVCFLEGDFLALDFYGRMFDCVVSATALHHMTYDLALSRMVDLTRPGGRLIIHDMRRDSSVFDSICAYIALAQNVFMRLIRAGRPRLPSQVSEAWARHGASESCLSLREARRFANRHLPGARVLNHWLWRYTIVWDKPSAA